MATAGAPGPVMDPNVMAGGSIMGVGASPQMQQRYPYATLNNRGYTNGNGNQR